MLHAIYSFYDNAIWATSRLWKLMLQ